MTANGWQEGCQHRTSCPRRFGLACRECPGVPDTVPTDWATIKRKPRPLRRKMNGKLVRAFLELGTDASLERIAEHAGCSVATVKRYLQRAGQEIAP